MAVIHDMAALAVTISPTARQSQQMRGPEVEVEPVVMQPDTQAMTDQAGWHGVEDPPENEAARRGDGDMSLFAIRGPAGRQRLKHGALGIDTLAIVGIAPATELIKETTIGRKIAEVGRAAQQKRIRDGPLQVAMRPLNRTILMRDPAVVAARRHGVMGAKSFVAQRPVGVCVAFHVAERGRKTVTAMFARGATQSPKGILQPFGQRHEALTAQHNMDMLKAAIGQPEVIKPMDQRLACNGDAQIGHVGEIRQTHPARLLDLAENDLPLRFTQDGRHAGPANG